MEWRDLLPLDLQRAAYRANDEMAWSKADAIRVVEILKINGYVVLGVDIWLATRPGPTIPTPFVYDWAATVDPPSWKKNPKTADEFIRNFGWAAADRLNQGKEPYFNITAKRCDS
jgi:hypothetical protein